MVNIIFDGVRQFDKSNLFDRVDLIGSLPNQVRVKVDGSNAWARISAAWAFEALAETGFCGFDIWGEMECTGLVSNAPGGSISVYLEAGITQYRTEKALDEINPSVDLPLRNMRSRCVGLASGNPYPEGYVDDTQGVHPIDPLGAQVGARFAYSSPSDGYSVEGGDKFFVGFYCEITVSPLSHISFHLNDAGTLLMKSPYVGYWANQGCRP
jgi:hypothetical protein